jgi:hypothetical protein
VRPALPVSPTTKRAATALETSSMDMMLARWVIVSVLVLLMGILVYRLTRPKPPSDELFR